VSTVTEALEARGLVLDRLAARAAAKEKAADPAA
jgi:hypothetical protein